MDRPVDHYWRTRLRYLQKMLDKNNFESHLAETAEEAARKVQTEIIPAAAPETIAFGGSMTVVKSGLYESLKNDGRYDINDTLDTSLPPEVFMERRRQALLSDLFITGTNAVTEKGQLVNLDMIGNRVAALTFGPKYVVILIGRNKVAHDLPTAMHRVKEYASPTNAMRLDKKTPCVETAWCEECKSPHRICNYWTITEKSFPKGRIKVVLINEEMGL